MSIYIIGVAIGFSVFLVCWALFVSYARHRREVTFRQTLRTRGYSEREIDIAVREQEW